nr:Mu transposase C-terminal domain-containing protein [Caldimonas tepidiphila]
MRRQVTVRYHPEDLSRIFVSVSGKQYIEARYADLRRPPVTLWEQRAACRILRASGRGPVSEALIFKAIEQQRRIVASARARTQRSRRQSPAKQASASGPWTPPPAPNPASEVDYSCPVDPFPVEVW